MTQHETDTITGEFIQNGYFNLIPHERGVISMARTALSMDSCLLYTSYLMRAPSGGYNNTVVKVAEDSGRMYIQWSVDGIDSVSYTHLPIIIGTNDLPERPIFIKSFSIRKAVRAIYPESSRKERKKNNSIICGKNVMTRCV